MKSTRVSLSSIRPGEDTNPRKTGRSEGVSELAASIKAHGLQTPINVRLIHEGDAEVYEIIDGRRRFAALTKLHGKAAEQYLIPVCVFDVDEKEARERALVANVIRVNMHPVDEFEAFQSLVNDGWAVPQISKRFGIKEREVGRALQIAALAPELREEWRKGKLTPDQAAALSSTPDQDLQRKVWKEASKDKHNDYGRRPDSLRREIRGQSEGCLASDAMAKFVGIDAYVAAGGRVREDLFSEEKTLLDPEVLKAIAKEKLDAKAAELIADGWAWALPQGKLPVPSYQMRDLDVEPFATDEERAALGGKAGQAWKVREAINERLFDDPKARALSGVIIGFDNDGDFDLDMLKLMPENAAQDGEGDGAESGEAGEDDDPRDGEPDATEAAEDAPKVNYALRERLSEMMTMALSGALRDTPNVALAVLFASLEHDLSHFGGTTPLCVSTANAWSGLNGERESIEAWVKTFDQATRCTTVESLVRAIALVVARLIDVRMVKHDYRRGAEFQAQRDSMVEAIARALPAEEVRAAIKKAFDAGAYFKGVNADECKAALVEMGWTGKSPGKKGDLVKACVDLAALTGWLPPEMRTPHYAGPMTRNSKTAE